jgi:hypothetical protein
MLVVVVGVAIVLELLGLVDQAVALTGVALEMVGLAQRTQGEVVAVLLVAARVVFMAAQAAQA